MRQVGGLLRKLGSLLGPAHRLLCLLGSLPGLLGSLSELIGSLSQMLGGLAHLVGLLRLEAGAQRLEIRCGNTRLRRLAEVLLLGGFVKVRILYPGLGRFPGHNVGLAGLRHALAGGSLLSLVPRHDRSSRRDRPRLPA